MSIGEKLEMNVEELRTLKINLFYNVITIIILLVILTGTLYKSPLNKEKLSFITKLFSSKDTNMNDFIDFSGQLIPLLMIIFAIALYNFMSGNYITKESGSIPFPKKIKNISKKINNLLAKKLSAFIGIIILNISLVLLFKFSSNVEVTVQYVTFIFTIYIILYEMILKPIRNKMNSAVKFRLLKGKYTKRQIDIFNSILIVTLFLIFSYFTKSYLRVLLCVMVIMFIYSLIKYTLERKNLILLHKNKAYWNQLLILLLINFLLVRDIPTSYLGFYFFFLFIIVKVILFIVSLISSLLLDEHKIAQLEKQTSLNREIINTIINQIEDYKITEEKRNTLKNILLHQLNQDNYVLNHINGFIFFIDHVNDNTLTKSEFLFIYKKMLINYEETSKSLGRIVKNRNLKNLLVPCLLILLILLSEFFNQYYSLFEDSVIKTFRSLLFAIVMYRLVTRFIEIGVAFYFDIKPDYTIKKTDLTNNDRVVLVLKSLIEITLLSSILYFEYSLINNEVKNFSVVVLTFLESVKYAVAVALFNLSYPVNFLKDMTGINEFKALKLHNTFYFVHLIQLLMSVLLISLSISSYSSRHITGSSFHIKKRGEKFSIIEKLKGSNSTKLIIDNEDLDTMLESLKKKWETGIIDNYVYLEIQELINFSVKKIK